ncbi:MAG: ribonuclease H-like domain-containing protein [Vicinamibacteria bacterium]|nr:ribonuclease H-like domain-containing protein [Vicinamibacteria bacterium]
MALSLRERLARLKEDGGAGPAPARVEAPVAVEAAVPASPAREGAEALARLERSMLGAPAEGLSLRDRLARLAAAVPARRERAAEPFATTRVRDGEEDGASFTHVSTAFDDEWDVRVPRRRVPIEELVQGLRVENAHGEFFRVDEHAPLERFHGDLPLSRLTSLPAEGARLLTGDASLAGLDLARVAFLDTETTGLSGGAGTAAFLVGLGYVEDDRFVVRQYFMRDYHEEASLLAALAEDLARFDGLATFNGRNFDVPLLETRFRLNRMRFPLSDAPHLDLLHPARRLWKLRLESCTLQRLERELLGVQRHGDVPGADVPHLWFRFIRDGDARGMAKVLQHNRLDILSLAALAALATSWVSEGQAEDARDVWSLARALAHAREGDRSEAVFRRAADDEHSPFRGEALLELARRARRRGATAEEGDALDKAASTGEPRALRALAIHLEHRRRDPGAALDAAQRALDALMAGEGDVLLAADLRGRLERLARKRAKAAVSPRSKQGT